MAQMMKESTNSSPADPPNDQTENSSPSETKDTSSPSTAGTQAEQSENSSHSESKGDEPNCVHFCNQVTARELPFQHGYEDKSEEKCIMWYNEHEIEAQMIENHRVVRRSQRILKCVSEEDDTRGLESLMSDKEQMRHEKITAVVLNEQRKQKMADNHDLERIAKECAKISDQAMEEAIQRGKYDEDVAKGGEGKTENVSPNKYLSSPSSGDDRKKKSMRARFGKFTPSFRITKSKKK